jgi:polysaccharide biosynthesis transport protein
MEEQTFREMNDGRPTPASSAAPARESPVVAGEGLLEHWLGILGRRKWVILQAVIVVPAVALALSLAKHKEYTATASLLFESAPTATAPGEGAAPGTVDPTRQAATNGELVGLPAVARRAAGRLGRGVTASQVSSSVSIDSSGDADIAKISATTRSPRLAAAMANAYGEAYVAFRRAADRDQLQSAIDLVDRKLAMLTSEERAGPVGRALERQRGRLNVAQALQTGDAELVQAASPPSSASSPKVKRNVTLGVVVGAMLGLLLAALLERTDRRVKSLEEVEKLFGLPILARIPRSRALAARQAKDQLPLDTSAGEAFRALRGNLRHVNISRELRSVLVTSYEAAEGKSTVARQLAFSMAEVGDNVVLVDADLHHGASNTLSSSSEHGLTSVLAGLPLERALTSVPLVAGPDGDVGAQLTVLPAGPAPPNPSDLLESERVPALLDELEERFDLVVVDSPALGVASDALPLVPVVSGVLIVCGLGRATRDGARELLRQLTLVDGYLLGVVADFVSPESGGYHTYHRRSRASIALTGTFRRRDLTGR